MSRPIIRTVTGDIAAGDVTGAVNYHEHLFQISPLLPGDELIDPTRSGQEAELLYAAGTELMIDATPRGLGARPDDVQKISARTGLKVVHATGLHHGGHYPDGHPLRSVTADVLTDRLIEDVTRGLTDTGVRAGIIKAAIRYWSMGPFERKGLTAAARAHVATGAPVMIHLDHGSGTHEVLDLLAAEGVEANSVVLAHIDRNLDPGLHADLASRGAYLGYDGWARHKEAPDSAILDCLADVIARGGGQRVVLGGDVARATRYISYGGMPGLAYVAERVFPRLRADEPLSTSFDAITRDNALALLTFAPTNPGHSASMRQEADDSASGSSTISPVSKG